MPGKRKVRIYSEDGNKVKLVQRRSGKKERQVRSKYDDVNNTGGNIIKTVTRMPGSVEKEIERGNKRIEVQKYKDEGIKNRTVIDMKKNDKYKDNIIKAGIKGALSGAGMNTFQSALKNSSFKNMPKQMYDNANSSKNTQIDGEVSKSKPLTTPQKKLVNIISPVEILKGTLDNMSTDGGFKQNPKTGRAIKNKK